MGQVQDWLEEQRINWDLPMSVDMFFSQQGVRTKILKRPASTRQVTRPSKLPKEEMKVEELEISKPNELQSDDDDVIEQTEEEYGDPHGGGAAVTSKSCPAASTR